MNLFPRLPETSTSSAPPPRNRFLLVMLVPVILAVGGRLSVAADNNTKSKQPPESAAVIYLSGDSFAKGIDFSKSAPRDYYQAIKWHAKVYESVLERRQNALSVVENQALAKDKADYAAHVENYLASEKDLGFYGVAYTQVQEMIEKKYGKMKFVKNNGQLKIADSGGKEIGQYSGDVVGEVCGPEGCIQVDPVVALFAILAGWFEKTANDDRFPSAGDALAYRAKYPLGGPNSELGKWRRKHLSGNDELSKLARNPLKRTIEIHANWLKSVKIHKDDLKIHKDDLKIHKDDLKIHKDDLKELFK